MGGKFICLTLSRAHRAQVPILYPAGIRNTHDRASLHTLVCAPRRHVSEEEASDVSIGLQFKPDRDGHVTGRAWVGLLLRYMLAPLLARGSVWPHGQCFTRPECTRNPTVSSATLPRSGNLFNFHFQLALVPITCEQKHFLHNANTLPV